MSSCGKPHEAYCPKRNLSWGEGEVPQSWPRGVSQSWLGGVPQYQAGQGYHPPFRWWTDWKYYLPYPSDTGGNKIKHCNPLSLIFIWARRAAMLVGVTQKFFDKTGHSCLRTSITPRFYERRPLVSTDSVLCPVSGQCLESHVRLIFLLNDWNMYSTTTLRPSDDLKSN